MAAATIITMDQLPAEIGLAIASMGSVQFAPVGRMIERAAKTSVQLGFVRSVSPEGEPWAPLRHQRVYQGSNNKILQNFGYLYASIQAKATAKDLTVSSNLIYAGVHQFGARITPKKGKFLAIPATKEASRAGGARRFRSPLHAIINRRGTGGVLLDSQDVVQYYLTKEVTVPARPFLGFSKQLIGEIGEILTDAALRSFTFGLPAGGTPASTAPTRA